MSEGDNSYEAHYEEKVATCNECLLSRDYTWDQSGWEAVACVDRSSIGGYPQTPLDSKHVTNMQKERAWNRKHKKRLPSWMR